MGFLLPSSERALQDPHLHGGGVHCHPPGGKLDMHLVRPCIYSRAARRCDRRVTDVFSGLQYSPSERKGAPLESNRVFNS
jgi:hypothetical protein